jgi:hypothetical protein
LPADGTAKRPCHDVPALCTYLRVVYLLTM